MIGFATYFFFFAQFMFSMSKMTLVAFCTKALLNEVFAKLGFKQNANFLTKLALAWQRNFLQSLQQP